jgi:hypothetical protein
LRKSMKYTTTTTTTTTVPEFVWKTWENRWNILPPPLPLLLSQNLSERLEKTHEIYYYHHYYYYYCPRICLKHLRTLMKYYHYYY